MLPTLKPTSQPPVVLSGLHYDSTPNTSLISHSRSKQDNDNKHCLVGPVYDLQTKIKILCIA